LRAAKQYVSPAFESACTQKKRVPGLRNRNGGRRCHFDTFRNAPSGSPLAFSYPSTSAPLLRNNTALDLDEGGAGREIVRFA
jgi:hypothetical protein